jgi:hypothetical protein
MEYRFNKLTPPAPQHVFRMLSRSTSLSYTPGNLIFHRITMAFGGASFLALGGLKSLLPPNRATPSFPYKPTRRGNLHSPSLPPSSLPLPPSLPPSLPPPPPPHPGLISLANEV